MPGYLLLEQQPGVGEAEVDQLDGAAEPDLGLLGLLVVDAVVD